MCSGDSRAEPTTAETESPESQAEHMCRDSQAEQCHILPGGSRLDTTPAVPVKVDSGPCRAEQCQAETEPQIEEDPAEQTTPNMPREVRAEQCLPAAQDDQDTPVSRGQAEQDGSHSSSNTQIIRQSHTIPWAVARYVPIPVISNIFPVLTNINLGTSPTDSLAEHKHAEDGRAEQQCSKDSQAEPCPDEAVSRAVTPTHQQVQAKSQIVATEAPQDAKTAP